MKIQVDHFETYTNAQAIKIGPENTEAMTINPNESEADIKVKGTMLETVKRLQIPQIQDI